MVNPQLAKAIEQLEYQVTVGDVAAQSGLNINVAQSGLLALASDVGAAMRVSETGDIAYVFPRQYRAILRNKYWRLRFQEWAQKVWNVLFYLLRISFGIFLLLSIVLIFVTLAVIMIAYSSSQEGDRRDNRSSEGIFWPGFWWSSNWGWWFSPSPRSQPLYQRSRSHQNSMNFFEAVFSVLFGDGNPNADLESKRWQKIGKVIRQNQGAVVAEQVLPYLDLAPSVSDEDFMIPVLSRFNGYPQVTAQGQIVYQFPELQTTAQDRDEIAISSQLREELWKFSRASSGQVILTVGLGGVNLIGAVVLSSLLRDGTLALQLGGLVAFASSVIWILLVYGIGFLAIPLGRYFWIQRQNQAIQARNDLRKQSAIALAAPSSDLRLKLTAAEQYRGKVILSQEELAYTTEQNLLDQETGPI